MSKQESQERSQKLKTNKTRNVSVGHGCPP